MGDWKPRESCEWKKINQSGFYLWIFLFVLFSITIKSTKSGVRCLDSSPGSLTHYETLSKLFSLSVFYFLVSKVDIIHIFSTYLTHKVIVRLKWSDTRKTHRTVVLKVWTPDRQYQHHLGAFLEMQILGPHSRPTESETLGCGGTIQQVLQVILMARVWSYLDLN